MRRTKVFTEKQREIYRLGYRSGYSSGRAKFGKDCKYADETDQTIHAVGVENGEADRNAIIILNRRIKLLAAVVNQQDHLDEMCKDAIEALEDYRRKSPQEIHNLIHMLKSKLHTNERKQRKNLNLAIEAEQ